MKKTFVREIGLVAFLFIEIGTVGTVLRAQAPQTSAPPALSELEQTKVELLQVRTAYAQLLAQYDACKAEVGSTFNALGQLRAQAATTQLTQEELKLKATVEADHPGYEWDPKTQLFTKKPEPKASDSKKSGGS